MRQSVQIIYSYTCPFWWSCTCTNMRQLRHKRMGPFTLQPRPDPCQAHLGAGPRLMHLHLPSGPGLFMSLSLQTWYLSAIFPDWSSVFQTAGDIQQMLSKAQPYSGAELSMTHFRPGQPSVIAISCAHRQPCHPWCATVQAECSCWRAQWAISSLIWFFQEPDSLACVILCDHILSLYWFCHWPHSLAYVIYCDQILSLPQFCH